MRILGLGLVCFTVFFSASVISSGQESASGAKAERVNAAIKELAEGAQPAQRVQAAELLGQSRDRRAARPLIAALRDSDRGVQRAAAAALGQLRDPAAVEPLLGILRMNSEPLVRSAAAFALGLIQDRRAVDPLIGALQDSDIGVRMNSALSLGRLGDPRAVEPLLALPHDKEHQACISSALALGQLKSEFRVHMFPKAPKIRLGFYSVNATNRNNPHDVFNNVASPFFGQFAGLDKRVNGIVLDFVH